MSHAETMFHIVAYDISNDRVRTRIHKLLERYGTWTQFSMFECFLSRKQSVKLVAEIKDLLQEHEAHVRIYTLSSDDVQRTITIGGEPPCEADVFIT